MQLSQPWRRSISSCGSPECGKYPNTVSNARLTLLSGDANRTEHKAFASGSEAAREQSKSRDPTSWLRSGAFLMLAKVNGCNYSTALALAPTPALALAVAFVVVLCLGPRQSALLPNERTGERSRVGANGGRRASTRARALRAVSYLLNLLLTSGDRWRERERSSAESAQDTCKQAATKTRLRQSARPPRAINTCAELET